MPGLVTVSPSANFLVVKATMKNETRRFRIASYDADMDRLTAVIRHHFNVENQTELCTYYVDSDGDMIRMSADVDFMEACRHAVVKNEFEKELMVYVESNRMDIDGPSPTEMARLVYSRLLANVVERTQRMINNLPPFGSPLEDEEDDEPEFGEFQSAPGSPELCSLQYETLRGQSPSHLSELERLDEEAVLLPSPLRVRNLARQHGDWEFCNNASDRVHLSPPQVDMQPDRSQRMLDYESDGHGCEYEDLIARPILPETGNASDDGSSERTETGSARDVKPSGLRRHGKSSQHLAIDRKPRISQGKFRVPFPAFVSFPPSPTEPAPLFSLSEHTPFPFSPPSRTVDSCLCSMRAGSVRFVSTSTDDDQVRSVGTLTEQKGRANMCVGPEKPKTVSVATQTTPRVVITVGVQSDEADPHAHLDAVHQFPDGPHSMTEEDEEILEDIVIEENEDDADDSQMADGATEEDYEFL